MGEVDVVLKRAHTNLGDYEEGVIADILARLPVKSLIRFRCVCKSWRALISDSYFVKKHLSYGERGITERTHRLIIFMLDDVSPLEILALENTKDDDDGDGAAGGQFAVTQLDCPVTKTITYSRHRILVGSCNGLVCVELDLGAIMLWNPSTRDSKVLPKPPRVINSKFSYCFYGFGYDSASDDYKVIRGFTDFAKKIMIHIFSLKTGSWRTVEDIDYVGFIMGKGLFLNGALHWLYCLPEGGSRILSFDLGAEKFQKTIPLPYDDWFRDPLIHKNCLCVLTCPTGTNNFNIWMMKEYGVKESWTEVLQFSLFDEKIYAGYFDDNTKYFRPVCMLENGVVLIDEMGMCEDLLVLSNLKEKTFKHVVEVATSLDIRTVIYRETLVSPDVHTYKTNNVS
ncbi:putative F-box domain-containing protein [Rosa chinensis]|uniref:Putative F-box domain-containing protein n=2 Tax=Rosa chinensis TaxID=74649 RepID=A0A2P6S111_ROSCH|nr:F-box/kelch-repeat protein At3g06240 isoform X2 [Rosa chinensis]PRQ52355.1 putative F-box domain-containing protein [Rosa chinensis]